MKKAIVLLVLAIVMAAVATPILAQMDRPLIDDDSQTTDIFCSVGSGCAERLGTERMLTFNPPQGAEVVEIEATCTSTGGDEPDERASLQTPFGEFTCSDPGAPPMWNQMTSGGEIVLSGPAQTLNLMARNIGVGFTNSMQVDVVVRWYGAAPTEEPTETFTPTNTPEPTVVSTETPELTETPAPTVTGEPTIEVTDEPTVEATELAILPPPTEMPLAGQCVAIPGETLPQGVIPWESATWEDGRHFGSADGEYAFVSEKNEIVLNFSPSTIKGNALTIVFGETIITVNVTLNSCEIPAEQATEAVIDPTPCPIDGCVDVNNETPNNVGRRWEYAGLVYIESYLPFIVNGEMAMSRLYNGEVRYFAYGLSPNDTIVGVAGIMDYGPCSLTIQPIMFAGDETNISIPKLPSMWPAIWIEWAQNMGFCEEYINNVLLPMVNATPLNGNVEIDLVQARNYCR